MMSDRSLPQDSRSPGALPLGTTAQREFTEERASSGGHHHPDGTGYFPSSPIESAITAAWTLEATFNFFITLLMWKFVVRSLMLRI
jgi:hypothetical protein